MTGSAGPDERSEQPAAAADLTTTTEPRRGCSSRSVVIALGVWVLIGAVGLLWLSSALGGSSSSMAVLILAPFILGGPVIWALGLIVLGFLLLVISRAAPARAGATLSHRQARTRLPRRSGALISTFISLAAIAIGVAVLGIITLATGPQGRNEGSCEVGGPCTQDTVIGLPRAGISVVVPEGWDVFHRLDDPLLEPVEPDDRLLWINRWNSSAQTLTVMSVILGSQVLGPSAPPVNTLDELEAAAIKSPASATDFLRVTSTVRVERITFPIGPGSCLTYQTDHYGSRSNDAGSMNYDCWFFVGGTPVVVHSVDVPWEDFAAFVRSAEALPQPAPTP